MFDLILGIRVRRSLRRGDAEVASLGPRSAPHLVRALEDPALRQAAERALVRLGGAARPALLKRLGMRKGARRIVAILGRLRPRADASPLIPYLQDPSTKMRRVAARAISRQGGGLAHSAMADAASDVDPVVRGIALAHLTATQDPRAIRHLVRLAAKGDPELSRAACARILELGFLAVSPLVDALRTSDDAIRTTVAYLLDGLEDEDSLVILSKALEEDDERIWPLVRDAFLRKGPETAPILAPLAGHPDARVRRTAMSVLNRWESPSPSP